MSSDIQASNIKVQPADPAKIRKIWRVALLLAVVTLIEFAFAFTLPRGILLYAIFIGLTFVKAFYIISEFMHLKHEVKFLIWSISLPVIFVIWLIIALLVEGDTIYEIRELFNFF